MVADNPKGFNNAVLALLDACEGDRRTGKGRCPICNKMALSVSNGNKVAVVIHCFGGSKEHDLEVIAKLRALDLWPTNDKIASPPPEAEKRSDDARRQYATDIWNGLKGSGRRLAPLLLDYLSARAIKQVPATARIVMPIAYHDSGRTAHDPGMVLPVRSKNGVLQGIHVVWLNGNLTAKREAEPQRQSYGLIQGNFIPLFKFEPDHAPDTLLIAEGAETAMAAAQLSNVAAIAAGGKGFFKDLDPPQCANYVILVDNDEDGDSRKFAGLLAQRLVGCAVRIAMPEKPEGGKKGYDWNDALVDAGGDESKLAELGRLIREAPLFESVMTREEKREIRLNALARLRLDDALAYEEQRDAAHNELGLRKTVLDDEVARRCDLLKAAQEKAPPPVDIELLEASAREIIASRDVLELFADKFSRVIAGEAPLAKLMYLVATSRLFDKCMHAAIKGPSSAGKSEIRKRVLDYFPSESVITFTALSERALLYMQGDFDHKVLSMGEAMSGEEAKLQDYLLRELMSEGKLRYPVATKVGGRIETVTIEKNGPVAFVVTTTKNKLHDENETRMLSLDVDDSEAQTSKVLRKVARVEGLNLQPPAADLLPWQDYQRWLALGKCTVTIPYAPSLAKLITQTRSVRLRRDFGQLLRAIKAHALLHRKHRRLNSRGWIAANEQDYIAVRSLMADLLASASEIKMHETIEDTVDAVRRIAARRSDPDVDGARVLEVADDLKLDRSATYRRLRSAEEAGYIINLEQSRGRAARFRLANDTPMSAAEQLLPSAEDLMEEHQERLRRAHTRSHPPTEQAAQHKAKS